MVTREAVTRKVLDALNSKDFLPHEKWVIKMQYRNIMLPGNFECKLWEAICAADEDNLNRLSRGFPEQVAGYLAWSQGGLAKKIRKWGLDV